jgi:hypothetical protein
MPQRIAPVIDPDTGLATEINPPAGGSWLRDADGGLTPADEATARGAGLDWATDARPDSNP